MEQNNIITFIDEKGKKIDYEVLDIQLYQGNIYCVCYLTDNSSTEVYIFRVEETENKDYDNYILETDENITNEVFKRFKEKNKDTIEFL